MKRYGNLSGSSGVVAYEVKDKGSSIVLKFQGGDAYLYDGRKPGKRDVLEMIRLAHEGRGLSTYVSQHVRERYAEKLS